jgi:hypothetical protein
MRRLSSVLSTIFLSAGFMVSVPLTGAALADGCKQRFIDIVIFSKERGYDGALKSFITQEVNGAQISKNYYHYIDKENWMTEMVEPAGAPWSLARNNVLYVSNDKGISWQKVREMDAIEPADTVSQIQLDRAASVRNTKCTKEDLNGEMLEVLYGEYDMLNGVEGSIGEKMWLSPDASWVPKSMMNLKMAGSETKTIQLIEKMPELTLPTPE